MSTKKKFQRSTFTTQSKNLTAEIRGVLEVNKGTVQAGVFYYTLF